MNDHDIKAVALAKLINISEGLVSDILHYRKGLSKESIRILSNHFKLKQEAFNRPYNLISNPGIQKRPPRVRKITKSLVSCVKIY